MPRATRSSRKANEKGEISLESVGHQKKKAAQKSRKKSSKVESRDADAYNADTEQDGGSMADEKEDLGSCKVSEFTVKRISLNTDYHCKAAGVIDQENTTPPDSHSTPALSRAVRRLDDSLYGFNDMVSPMPFSPVVFNQNDSLLSDEDQEQSTLVANKRQFPTGVFDIPIEVPKKRKARRKPCPEPADPDRVLLALQEQFDEVEMHELAIE